MTMRNEQLLTIRSSIGTEFKFACKELLDISRATTFLVKCIAFCNYLGGFKSDLGCHIQYFNKGNEMCGMNTAVASIGLEAAALYSALHTLTWVGESAGSFACPELSPQLSPQLSPRAPMDMEGLNFDYNFLGIESKCAALPAQRLPDQTFHAATTPRHCMGGRRNGTSGGTPHRRSHPAR